MTVETISINEQMQIETKESKDSTFWKNEIIKYIEKAKIDTHKRKPTLEKEDDILNDIRKNIQNLAMQAKSYYIHKKNTQKIKFEVGKRDFPEKFREKVIKKLNKKLFQINAEDIKNELERAYQKEHQKEIHQYQSIEEKWRRLEQMCIRWSKKRAIRTLVNGSLFKNLINQPENNRFTYTTKTSKKLYDVVVLGKETVNDKTIYQLEMAEGKPLKFAVSMDKNQEEHFFQTSKNTSTIEWLQEIEDTIYNFLNKIPW